MATAPEPENPAAPRRLTISDGDDKHAMLLQLALIGTEGAGTVMFMLSIKYPAALADEAPMTVGVTLTGVEAYGSEGTCWNISGDISQLSLEQYPWLRPYSRFCAVYHVEWRNGTFGANQEYLPTGNSE